MQRIVTEVGTEHAGFPLSFYFTPAARSVSAFSLRLTPFHLSLPFSAFLKTASRARDRVRSDVSTFHKEKPAPLTQNGHAALASLGLADKREEEKRENAVSRGLDESGKL